MVKVTDLEIEVEQTTHDYFNVWVFDKSKKVGHKIVAHELFKIEKGKRIRSLDTDRKRGIIKFTRTETND